MNITSFPQPYQRTEFDVSCVKVIHSATSFSLLLTWATSVIVHTPVLSQDLDCNGSDISVLSCL